MTQQLANFTSISTIPSVCTIGNNLNLADPTNIYIRHLLFSKMILYQNTNLGQLIHLINLPTDINTLAYYRFSSSQSHQIETKNQQSYIYTAPISGDFSIQQNQEPEFVCYCTGSNSNSTFLQLNPTLVLNPFKLASNTIFNSTGFYIDFQIYVYKPSQIYTQDEILISIPNLINIYLQNYNSLRIELYNNSGSIFTQLLTSYQFRYNFWTQYTLQISSTKIILFVDGSQVSSVVNPILTNMASITNPIIYLNTPQTITYLISNLTVRNSKRIQAFTQGFSQYQINSTYATQILQQGNMQFQYSNDYCTMQQANQTTYWNGINCIDNKLIPYFQNQNTQTSLIGQLYSSQQSMTIEMWIKDMNTNSQISSSTDIQIQISIITGNTRNISCTPQITAYPTQTSNIVNQQAYNNWGHYVCISDYSLQQVKSIYYNPITQLNSTSIIQNINFIDVQQPLTLSLGSSLTGTNKFQGFIKQLRIWGLVRSDYQIQIFRYQQISKSQNNLLLHNFQLDDQQNAFQLYDSDRLYYLTETSTYQYSLVSYITESNTPICQNGYYYTGTCCQVFNISTADFSIVYIQSTDQLQISINQATLLNSNLFTSMKASFSLVNIGNTFQYNNQGTQTDYLSYIQPLFNSQGVQSFIVLGNQISTQAYSLTISATIYSDYMPSVQIQRSHTFVLICPNIWTYIVPNIINPSITQLVSQTSNDQTPIINTIIQSQCYNPSSNSFVQAQNVAIQWNWSLTALSLSSYFQKSNDSLTLNAISSQAKQLLTENNSQFRIYANLSYGPNNNKQVVGTSVLLQLVSQTIITNNPLSQSISITQGSIDQQVYIDLSQAIITPSTSQQIQYSVICPYSLFQSQAQYNQYCVISQTGILQISASNIIAQYNVIPYYIYIYMTIPGTSIVQVFTVNITIYQDGQSICQDQCPCIILQNQYTFNQYYYYLSCSGYYYQIQQPYWSANDINNSSITYNSSIFQYGSQLQNLNANLTNQSLQQYQVQSGSILDVSLTLGLLDQQGNYLQNISTQTQVNLGYQNLIVNIQVLNGKQQPILNNNVAFTEQYLILSSSQSIDPDSPTTGMTYYWTCPDILYNTYDCSSLMSGQNGQLLTLNTYQRVNASLLFNTPYTFTVTATSKNPYKPQQQASVSITFMPPSKQDQSTNTLISSCDQMSISGSLLYIVNKTQKVEQFDITNYTNTQFNVQTNITQGSCSYGNILEQSLLLYVFDSPQYFGITDIPQRIYTQSSLIGINSQISQIIILNNNLPNLNQVTSNQYYQVNLYWFTVRILPTGIQTISINIDTIYYIRYLAQLQAVLSLSQVQVDKYQDLILDASQSFDPENLESQYTFNWTCPGNIKACATQYSSTLKLSPIDRQSANSNAVGINYTYSVIMTNGQRKSQSTSTIVQIQISNYQNCATTYIDTQYYNQNYQNNILYIQYNQQQLIPVILLSYFNCNYVTLSTTSFTSDINKVYWQTGTSSSVNITSTLLQQFINVNTISTMTLVQYFYMGADSTQLLNNTLQIKVQLVSPDLVPIIKGSQISTIQNQQSTPIILLNANQAYDPAKLPMNYQWICPTYLGGNNCQNIQNGTSLSLNYSYIDYLTNGNGIQSLANTAHKFILVLSSQDGIRSISRSFYVYLTDQSSLFQIPSLSSCGIYLINDQGSYLKFLQINQFQYTCTSNTTFGNNTINGQNMLWGIDYLQKNSDFIVQGQQLYMRPYALQKINDIIFNNGYNNEISVMLNIQPSNIISQLTYSFMTVSSYLQYGSIQIQPNPQSYQSTYSQISSILIQNFKSSQNTGIQVQFRSYSLNYNNNQIIIPIKPYSLQIINTLYTNILLPYSNLLTFDFFDMNFTYLGSQQYQIPILQGQLIDCFTETDYNQQLGMIYQKTILNYSNIMTGKLSFEQDYYTIKILSEALQTRMLQSNIQMYSTQILTYIINNFITGVQLFNSTSTTYYDQQSKQVIERSTIYILNSILSLNQNLVSTQITSIIQILNQLINDYSQLIRDCDEQEVIRSTLIQIFELLTIQMNQQTNSAQLNTQLSAISGKLLINDFKGLTQGGQTNNITSGTSFRQVLYLTNGQQPFTFQNQIGTNDNVFISNQGYLSNNNITYLETTFALQSNPTSPVNSYIFINGYGSNNIRQSVQFQQNQDQLNAQISFQVRDQYLSQLQNPYFQAICQYYDQTNNIWSTDGVYYISNDTTLGIINCAIQHFSQFSVIFANNTPIPIANITPNGSSSSSSSDQSIPPIDDSNLNYFLQSSNTGKYIAIVVITIVLVNITIILTMTCARMTKWNYNIPNFNQMKYDKFKWITVFKESIQIHHSLYSAYISPIKGNIYVTHLQYNQMILSHIYFFIICLLVEFIIEHNTTTNWERSKIISIDIAIFFIFLAIRTIANTINSYIYFNTSYPLPKDYSQKKSNLKETEQDLKLENSNKKAKEGPEQYEGGEDDEEQKNIKSHQSPNSVKGVTSMRQIEASKPHQQKVAEPINDNLHKRGSVMDLDQDLNEIDVEIVDCGKNQFFNNRVNQMNIQKNSVISNKPLKRDFTRDDENNVYSSFEASAQKNDYQNNDIQKNTFRKNQQQFKQDEQPQQISYIQDQIINPHQIKYNNLIKEGQGQFEINNHQQSEINNDKNKQQDINIDKAPLPKNKNMKILGIIIKMTFLYAKIAITLWFLTRLQYLIDVQHFVRSIFGIYLVFTFIYEPITIAIFSIFISLLGGNNTCTKATGMILIGNFHPNIIRSVIWALNN